MESGGARERQKNSQSHSKIDSRFLFGYSGFQVTVKEQFQSAEEESVKILCLPKLLLKKESKRYLELNV